MNRATLFVLALLSGLPAWAHTGLFIDHEGMSSGEEVRHFLFTYPHAILSWVAILLLLVGVWRFVERLLAFIRAHRDLRIS